MLLARLDGVTLNPESEVVPLLLVVGESSLTPSPSMLVVGFELPCGMALGFTARPASGRLGSYPKTY